MDKDSIINPEFATSVYYGEKPLTEAELKAILEKDCAIYQRFKRNGYIHSKEFSFITYATFSPDINSEIEGKWDGNKAPEQSQQAKKMLKIIEDYFNSIYIDKSDEVKKSLEPLKVDFIGRHDNECALYNSNRYTFNKINPILINIFGN